MFIIIIIIYILEWIICFRFWPHICCHFCLNYPHFVIICVHIYWDIVFRSKYTLILWNTVIYLKQKISLFWWVFYPNHVLNDIQWNNEKNEELKGMVKYLISENLMLNFYKLMFHRIRFLLTVMNIEYEGTTKNWLTQIKQKQMFHHHFICHIRIVRYQTQTPSICGNKLNRMHSNWILNDGRDNRSRTFILYGTMFRMVFQRFVVGIRC